MAWGGAGTRVVLVPQQLSQCSRVRLLVAVMTSWLPLLSKIQIPREGLWLASLEHLATLVVRGRISVTDSSIKIYQGRKNSPNKGGCHYQEQMKHWHGPIFLKNVASTPWNSSHQVTWLCLWDIEAWCYHGHLGLYQIWSLLRVFPMPLWFLHAFQTYSKNILAGPLFMLLISSCHLRVYLCRASMIWSVWALSPFMSLKMPYCLLGLCFPWLQMPTHLQAPMSSFLWPPCSLKSCSQWRRLM